VGWDSLPKRPIESSIVIMEPDKARHSSFSMFPSVHRTLKGLIVETIIASAQSRGEAPTKLSLFSSDFSRRMLNFFDPQLSTRYSFFIHPSAFLIHHLLQIVLSSTTIAQNTVSNNTFFGINVNGGFGGADGNRLDFDIKDNTVTDNGSVGIRVIVGQDNSSNNHAVADSREHPGAEPVVRYRGRCRGGSGELPHRRQCS
jgi:hypothetical protein